MAVVIDLEHRLDGFVTEAIGTNVNGEAIRIGAKPPRTPLRTLEQLWERYKPLKIMRCYNVKTQRFFQVFNPGWQKRTTGTVKGKMINILGRVAEKKAV